MQTPNPHYPPHTLPPAPLRPGRHYRPEKILLHDPGQLVLVRDIGVHCTGRGVAGEPVYEAGIQGEIFADPYRMTVEEGTLTGYENLIPGMEIFRTRKMVANEMEVLKSYSLAHRTLENLDFDITYVGVGGADLKKECLYESAPFYRHSGYLDAEYV